MVCFIQHALRIPSLVLLLLSIFIGNENGGNKGQPRDDTCKQCWMKQTLLDQATESGDTDHGSYLITESAALFHFARIFS